MEGNMKKAFTLAEVLITLGIIGVVAAMTLPALIQNNNNKVVETRLKKFYSVINQAIIMAEVDYGDKKIWYQDLKGAETDNEGNIIEGSSESEKWFKKYLAPYMKIASMEILPNGAFIVYLPDGSSFTPYYNNTRDWFVFPGNAKNCIKRYGYDFGQSGGICSFAFNFYPVSTENEWKYHYNKGIEPYKYNWDGTRAALYEGCKGVFPGVSDLHQYCTALIQYNNWTIPDDYPYKVSY